jgi:hypothetical protein
MRSHVGFMLIIVGIILTVFGLGVLYSDKIPYIGRLPGDFNIQGKGWSFHFPLFTGIIISIILTIILNFFLRR